MTCRLPIIENNVSVYLATLWAQSALENLVIQTDQSLLKNLMDQLDQYLRLLPCRRVFHLDLDDREHQYVRCIQLLRSDLWDLDSTRRARNKNKDYGCAVYMQCDHKFSTVYYNITICHTFRKMK